MVPAEDELVPVYVPVAILVEHRKDVARLFVVQRVYVAFVVPEQGSADEAELFGAQTVVPDEEGCFC